MNAPLGSQVLLLREDDAQASLPLSTPGVQRWVWESRYGSMLIEVLGGDVYVNSRLVEPHGEGNTSVGPPAV
jgi:hypothetical protein